MKKLLRIAFSLLTLMGQVKGIIICVNSKLETVTKRVIIEKNLKNSWCSVAL